MNKRFSKILLVDDEPSVLLALRLVLEATGLHVSAFGDPEDALEYLRAGSGTEVVLSDLKMPRLTGLQLLEGVREISPFLPFILMSAHATSAELKRLRELGGNGFLSKPFLPDQLKTVMNTMPVATGVLRRHEAGGVAPHI